MEAVLFDPATSTRRALILSLGSYGLEKLTPEASESLIEKLLDLYRNDRDAGIHGAADWTLRTWKYQEKIKLADSELSKLNDRSDRRWFVNRLGQSFSIIDGPVEFLMGSPQTEPDRENDEAQHRVLIPRRFAIASKEVSQEHWALF